MVNVIIFACQHVFSYSVRFNVPQDIKCSEPNLDRRHAKNVYSFRYYIQTKIKESLIYTSATIDTKLLSDREVSLGPLKAYQRSRETTHTIWGGIPP